MSEDDFDVFARYRDLWKTKKREMLSDKESSLLMSSMAWVKSCYSEN